MAILAPLRRARATAPWCGKSWRQTAQTSAWAVSHIRVRRRRARPRPVAHRGAGQQDKCKPMPCTTCAEVHALPILTAPGTLVRRACLLKWRQGQDFGRASFYTVVRLELMVQDISLMLGWFHKLLPREELFFEMFARHSEAVVAGAEALRAMLEGGDAIPRNY